MLDDPFRNSSSSSDGTEAACGKYDKPRPSVDTAQTAEKAQQGCALADVLMKVVLAGCRSARPCGEDAATKSSPAQGGARESPFPVAGNETSYSVLVE